MKFVNRIECLYDSAISRSYLIQRKRHVVSEWRNHREIGQDIGRMIVVC